MRTLGMFWKFLRQKSCHLLLILWIFSFYFKVKGVPIDSVIVRKARCYANCLTQNPAANKTAANCDSSNCQECLIPCGTPFSNEETCKQICNNVTTCEKSCVFLAQFPNVSSLLAGDGYFPPTPGIPRLTSSNFTSVSLKWDPTQNTSAAVVYLVEITVTGEQSRVSPKYFSEVFVSPKATVKFEYPCAYSAQGPSRFEYIDNFFRFKIAALTKSSSVSYGPQSSQMTLTKPDSVTNVTLVNLVYDSASSGGKIKLTVSWNPPEDQKDLISYYGVLFYADTSCQYDALPSTADSNGAEANLSMHIFHKSLKCIHTVEVYSIVGCSVSDPTVFNYTYPGCQNITNFPASECYKFDPPYTPLKDRMVSNVTLAGNMTAQQDNRFTVTLTWNPPVYPYKAPSIYFVKWSKEDSLKQTELEISTVARHTIKELLAGTSYKVEIKPTFPDGSPLSDWTSIILRTPAAHIPLEDRMVSNVTLEGPMRAQHDYRFTANVTWKPPLYPYIIPSMYLVRWSKENSLDRSHPALVNRQTITNLLPGTSYKLEIKPVYPDDKPLTNWTSVILATPGVDPDQVKVRYLTSGHFSPSSDGGSFSVKISWEKPTFNYSTLIFYKISYLSGGNNATSVELPPSSPHFIISGILQGERVGYWVIPIYQNDWIQGIAVSGNATAPDKEPLPDPLSAAKLAALVVGFLLAVLIAICVSLWCFRKRKRQRKAGHVSGKNASMIDHWEVDVDLVTLEEELGEGAFGKVYKGVIKELNTPSQKMFMMPPIGIRKNAVKQTGGYTVAVKMLHGMADSDQRREFLTEIELMKNMGSHKNIVNMLGCCTVQETMFLLVEYIPNGDLLHYLRKRRTKVTQNDEIYVDREAPKADNQDIHILSFTARPSETAEENGIQNKGMTKDDEANDGKGESEETLSPGDLIAFAWQISQGMEYLARKGFVHRDLAARNVLVGEHKVAKVADFGLTRHVYEEKVYHAKRSRKLPLKWMSIEAIFDQTFTTHSDVWAFGVLLWELVTLGGTPYPTINNRELLRLLKGGYRMEKPDICNEEIFSMMMDCWMENPDDRPNFTQIRERLEEMMQKDNPYLDFSVLDESKDYYKVPSFNSLNEGSAEDELFDTEKDELFKDGNDDNSLGEKKTTEEPYKDETGPLSSSKEGSEMDKDTGTVDVNMIDLNNSCLRDEGFRDRKDIKENIEALEMALYRPGRRGILL